MSDVLVKLETLATALEEKCTAAIQKEGFSVSEKLRDQIFEAIKYELLHSRNTQ